MRTILFLGLTLLGAAWTASDAQAGWFRNRGGYYNSGGYYYAQPTYSSGYFNGSTGYTRSTITNNGGSGYWPGYSNYNLYPGYMSTYYNLRPAYNGYGYGGYSYGGYRR